MRLRKKILIITAVVILLISAAIAIFLSLKGKTILIHKLEALTQRRVSIGHCGFILPLNLHITNLDIEGLLKADEFLVTPSLLSLVSGRVALNKLIIINPEFTYEKPGSPAGGSSKGASLSGDTLKSGVKNLSYFTVRRIDIRNGKLNFIDRGITKDGLKITVKDMNFQLDNKYIFPSSIITHFQLKGQIPWQEGAEEGRIYLKGWIDLFKKDIQATLKIEDIDGVYLYPYYSNWIDLEKARIEKAKLNFHSDIQGVDNNVTAKCRLELVDIVRKPRAPEEEQETAEKIADTVLDVLRALGQGKIVLDFNVKTKLDNPEFGFLGNIHMAFKEKLTKGLKADKYKVKEVANLPGNFFKRLTKSAADITKAAVESAKTIGVELQKTTEAIFKDRE